jgi:hypothetical protein
MDTLKKNEMAQSQIITLLKDKINKKIILIKQYNKLELIKQTYDKSYIHH